jgi:hypothetical protein
MQGLFADMLSGRESLGAPTVRQPVPSGGSAVQADILGGSAGTKKTIIVVPIPPKFHLTPETYLVTLKVHDLKIQP